MGLKVSGGGASSVSTLKHTTGLTPNALQRLAAAGSTDLTSRSLARGGIRSGGRDSVGRIDSRASSSEGIPSRSPRDRRPPSNRELGLQLFVNTNRRNSPPGLNLSPPNSSRSSRGDDAPRESVGVSVGGEARARDRRSGGAGAGGAGYHQPTPPSRERNGGMHLSPSPPQSRPPPLHFSPAHQVPRQQLSPAVAAAEELLQPRPPSTIRRSPVGFDQPSPRAVLADDAADTPGGAGTRPGSGTTAAPAEAPLAGAGQQGQQQGAGSAGGSCGAPAAAPAAAPATAPAQQQQPRPRVPPSVSAAYVMSSMLGAGAFGTVWMATGRESGERCAIKIIERRRQLHEDFALEPAEAEILKQVHHENIVKLIDLISTEASVYLVMELVLGGHLQTRIKEQGAYDEARAKVLLRQVVLAVQHLHERSIIHRDIKPENILFVGEDASSLQIKLTDFGLSTSKEGRLTTRCGTPSYCAPELLSGEGYGKQVDIWSIGILSYVILTAQLPFVGKDRHELFARIQRGQYTYPPPAEGQEEVSDLARDLISRLLKQMPMQRYTTRETQQHPWLCAPSDGDSDGAGPTDLTEVDPESLGTVHEMMRQFIAARRLKRAFIVVVACNRLLRVVVDRDWSFEDNGDSVREELPEAAFATLAVNEESGSGGGGGGGEV
jgi:hypothetical protein